MNDTRQLDKIIAELVVASENGQSGRLEEIVREHPQLADQLREFLELHQQFEQAHNLSSPSRAPKVSADPVARADLDQETFAGNIPTADTLGHSWGTNPPRFFGNYEIIEEIDRGGMGVVYKARHIELGRLVALKLIRSGELASETEIQRFHSEAEAAAALTHAGIVPIYDVGTLGGLVYFTMAYIDGENLAELGARGPLDPIDAVQIVYKLCEAVQHAHDAGVFHRDIKPANVLIDRSGQPILIDFGLAKFSNRDTSLTTTGQILGTPAYMAPEVASGKLAHWDASADVYALGGILYFLCAGQAPFNGPTPFDVLLQVLDRDPPPASKLNRKVSREIDHLCSRALCKDPKNRYSTASELADDLKKVLTGQPVHGLERSVAGHIESWWRRAPILFVHACGIGVTTTIVGLSYYLRGDYYPEFYFRMGLLIAWFATSFGLQYWVNRAKWRDIACLSWATIDVVLYTWLIAFASQPRSMLLIGYPMMIVASSLFYRNRFVIFMTTICIVGFLTLGWLAPQEDFIKPDFVAIFVCGLIVIGLSLLSTVHRVRSMSRYFE